MGQGGMPGAPGITMGPDGTIQQAPQLTPQQRALQAIMLAGRGAMQFPHGRMQQPGQQTPAMPGGPPPNIAPGSPSIPGATTPIPQTQTTPILGASGGGGGSMPGGGGGSIAPSGAANGFSFPNKRAAKTSSTYDILQSFVGLAKSQQAMNKKKEANEAKYLLLELNQTRSRYEQNRGDTQALEYYNALLADKRTQKVLKDVEGYSPAPMEGPPPAVQGAIAAAQQIQKSSAPQGGGGQAGGANTGPKPNPLASLMQRIGGAVTGRPNLPPQTQRPIPGPSQPVSNEQIDNGFQKLVSRAPSKEIGEAAQAVYDASKFTPGGRVQALQETAKMFASYAIESQKSGDAIAKLNAQEDIRSKIQQQHDKTMLDIEDKRVAGASAKEIEHMKGMLDIQDKRDATMLSALSEKLDAKNSPKPLNPQQRLNVERTQTAAQSMLKEIDSVLDNFDVVTSNSSSMKAWAAGMPVIGRMVKPSAKEVEVETAIDKRLPELVNQMRQAYGASGMRNHDAWKALQGLKGNLTQNPAVTKMTLQNAKEDLQNLMEDSKVALGAGASQGGGGKSNAPGGAKPGDPLGVL